MLSFTPSAIIKMQNFVPYHNTCMPLRLWPIYWTDYPSLYEFSLMDRHQELQQEELDGHALIANMPPQERQFHI